MRLEDELLHAFFRLEGQGCGCGPKGGGRLQFVVPHFDPTPQKSPPWAEHEHPVVMTHVVAERQQAPS